MNNPESKVQGGSLRSPASKKERKTVVWWRYFERYEERLTLEEFEALKRQWGAGEVAISTVDGLEALGRETDWKWTWGEP
jgi:hypothetical protein